MFGKKEIKENIKEIINADKVETVIGSETVMKGVITSKGTIRVDGGLEGEISTEGVLVIGQSGNVNANVAAKHMTVAGVLRGNANVQGTLEIVPTGKLYGDIHVGNLIIGDGAVFRGTCEMRGIEAEENRETVQAD